MAMTMKPIYTASQSSFFQRLDALLFDIVIQDLKFVTQDGHHAVRVAAAFLLDQRVVEFEVHGLQWPVVDTNCVPIRAAFFDSSVLGEVFVTQDWHQFLAVVFANGEVVASHSIVTVAG